MKRQIFMYLFIFSLLLILFQYVNSKQILEDKQQKLDNYKNKIEKYSDSLSLCQDNIFELSYFNLENNDNALSYFEEQDVDINTISTLIKDELFDTNQTEGEEHPIIPYASMTESKILIDAVRILNHKWLVASFSDGSYSGEMFISYNVNEDNKVDFKVLESFLYPI